MILDNDSPAPSGPKWSELPAARQKMRDRNAVRRYISGLGEGDEGQCCLVYVNDALDIIMALRWRGPGAFSLSHETAGIIERGEAIGAKGFIIARQDAGKNYRPAPSTIAAVGRLRRLSAELDLPLLDYLIFAKEQTVAVGGP